jgi:DNA-binding transcriptional LysR family regulator
MMFQWSGICEFIAVVESKSFTAASRELGISTAQVSRQVRALEDRLSVKLFYRSTRRVSLTEEGRLYYQRCRAVMDDLDDAERLLSESRQGLRGKLKITAPVSYGEDRIMPLINNFLQDYAELEIEVELTNQKIDLVEEAYDLAIRLGELKDSNLMAKQLSHRCFYVCASQAYLEKYGEANNLLDLKDHNCLGGTFDYWRFQEKGEAKKVRVSGNLRCNSGHALVDAAKKGLGIVQLPDYYLEESIATGDLKVILKDYQQREEGIWALCPDRRHVPVKVTTLINFLLKKLS